MDRWVFQTRRYGARAAGVGVGHPEAEDTYPRYNILAAIRVAVESSVPGDFDTLAALRGSLIAAGQTADDTFTRPPQGDIAARAIAEERELFCTFVRGLATRALHAVAPLPYRRSLGKAEHTRLWSHLRERWGPSEGGPWHPLLGEDLPPHVLALQQAWYARAIPPALLQRILRQHGVVRVWELREFGPEYELDLDELEPVYNFAEGYWTSGDMAWLVYASHESSITVAGEWLVAAIKAAWPDWDQHVYTDWQYDPPSAS